MDTSLKIEETALLLVHLQPDVIEAGTAFGNLFAPEATRKAVVAQANRAAKSIRSSGGTVVAIRIAFFPDGRDLSPSIPLLRMAKEAGVLIDGTKNADFVSELELSSEDLLLKHHRPGPFTGTALETLLRDRNIRNVIVGGVATNASVESTMRQSSDLGFNTYILTDVSSAADEASHEAALASMDLFAVRITLDDIG